MRILSNHAVVPVNIDLQYGDGPLTLTSVSDDTGLPISSNWLIAPEANNATYCGICGSLKAVGDTSAGLQASAIGASITYTVSSKKLTLGARTKSILTASPSDGSPTRSISITLS